MTTEKHKLAKRWYKWLRDHPTGVLRYLYLSPLVAVITTERWLVNFVCLLDAAIAITYQVGAAEKWNKEEPTMTLEKTIKLLESEYERAKSLEFVRNPLAYALYRVWMMADKSNYKQNIPTIDTGDLLAKIAELEAELKEERHRHDRYVDFELDEAKELHELREKNRWIPVTERMPKEYENVLCTDGVHVEGGELIEGSFYDLDTYDSSIISGVTHWMPLPDPPEIE